MARTRVPPLEDQWVVVTGASSGLGRAMALALARDHRAHVVPVARRREQLEDLQREVESWHGRRCMPVPGDLTVPEEIDEIFSAIVARCAPVAFVLNAGRTFYGRALDQPDDDLDAMIDLNVRGLVRLARRAGTHFVRARAGGILFISSVAGFAPQPYQATYAASKAFVTHYGLALGHELESHGVAVTVFAPGGIATEMISSSGLARAFPPGHFGLMDADRCAALGLRAFRAGTRLAVPGALNRLTVALLRVLPRRAAMAATERLYRRGLVAPEGARPRDAEPPVP